MPIHRLAALLVATLIIFSANADQRGAALSSALATKDYDKAEKALKTLLETEEGKAIAKSVLLESFEKRLVYFSASIKKAESSFRGLKNEVAVKKYLAAVDEWQTKADETMAFIMDEKSYPPPPRMPFSPGDKQLNQAVVEGKVEDVISMWNSLEMALGKMMGVKTDEARTPGGGYSGKIAKGKIKDPREEIVPMLEYKFSDCTKNLAASVPKWRTNFDSYKKNRDIIIAETKLCEEAGVQIKDIPKPDPLILAINHLFSGELETALEKKGKLDEPQARIFKIVGYRYLLFRSMTPDGDWKKNEIEALVLNNLYRLSLGLRPMMGNKKIQEASIKHSQYQAKAGMSHDEKDPARANPSLRIKLEGYNAGGETENVASTNEPVAAFWMWRMDSGHHKNLIRAQSKSAGIAGRGPATHNTASSTEDPFLDQL